MRPNQVIILQVGDIGRTTCRRFFDDNGIECNKQYLFFRSFGEDLASQIEPGVPQLVLTSHIHGNDAHDIASRVKKINPAALVVAFTTMEIDPVDGSQLDGCLSKFHCEKELACRFVKAFISGTDRRDLLRMLPKL